MRIATYNLWNSTVSWAQRLAAIAEELTVLDADVVAMQEAPTQATDKQSLIDFFRENTPYPNGLHLKYPEEPDEGDSPEGLAILSKRPVEPVWSSWEDDRATANNWAAKAVVDCCGASLSVTNVHLDWEHRASHEQHIAEIVRDVTEKCPCDHDILCGDFNDDVDSRVARFLAGEVSIAGSSTQWRDLAHAWHAVLGEVAPITVNFAGNPWRAETGDEVPARFDRIYLRSGKSSRNLRVVRAGLFGKERANSLGIVPSDHFGVFVDLKDRRVQGP